MGGLDDTNDYVTFDYDRLRMSIFESMTTTTTTTTRTFVAHEDPFRVQTFTWTPKSSVWELIVYGSLLVSVACTSVTVGSRRYACGRLGEEAEV